MVGWWWLRLSHCLWGLYLRWKHKCGYVHKPTRFLFPTNKVCGLYLRWKHISGYVHKPTRFLCPTNKVCGLYLRWKHISGCVHKPTRFLFPTNKVFGLYLRWKHISGYVHKPTRFLFPTNKAHCCTCVFVFGTNLIKHELLRPWAACVPSLQDMRMVDLELSLSIPILVTVFGKWICVGK